MMVESFLTEVRSARVGRLRLYYCYSIEKWICDPKVICKRCELVEDFAKSNHILTMQPPPKMIT